MFVPAVRFVIPFVLLSAVGIFAQERPAVSPSAIPPADVSSVVVAGPLSETAIGGATGSSAALVESGIVESGVPLSRPESNRAYRQEIRSMDILDRPYRNPLHVYGNTVRRRHDRGAFPLRSLWH